MSTYAAAPAEVTLSAIDIDKEIYAPIEKVWDVVQDHERLSEYTPIDVCTVTRHGEKEKNGLGAIREMTMFGFLSITEEVTFFDAPRAMEYLITDSSPIGIIHPAPGRIELTDLGGSTRITWQSNMGLDLPFGASLVNQINTPLLNFAFGGIVDFWKKNLEA